jgi:hypothetical protein
VGFFNKPKTLKIMSEIKFFLNVCKDKPLVELKGTKYLAGHQGEIEIGHEIKNDILYMDLSWCGHAPHVGGAANITAVSIRVCSDSVSTIAIYDDPKMNAMGCCHCCSNGCCVYGNSGCGCG